MLTDTKIKASKPKDKRYTIADGDGLYIEINPNGKKYWRFRTNKDGKRSWVGVGEYPLISAREAREARDKIRKKLLNGEPLREEAQITRKFEETAREWHQKFSYKWGSSIRQKIIRNLEIHVFPFIGNAEISELKPKDLLSVEQRIEASGALTMAQLSVQLCSRVFRYAISCGYCEYDPTQPIHEAMASPGHKHFAYITKPADISKLLKSIDAYPYAVVRGAMKFLSLTMLRPTESRLTEWSEIKDDEIHIPAERMKGKHPHIVPLSTQAKGILSDLYPLTGGCKYVFSGRPGKENRPIGRTTIFVALRYMGYTNGQITAHGFRHTASTILNGHGFNRDWIEYQLAHAPAGVRGVYNHAEYLPERRKMMQWYADYLDELRNN